MSFTVLPTLFDEVKILVPEIHRDGRGFFSETFQAQEFAQKVMPDVVFVQDNVSHSAAGVIRGLHFQLPPHAQAKLVRCVTGAVYDVVVDVRRASATFGRWISAELSAENGFSLWIPAGFAHGFMAISEATVIYKTDDYWDKASESAVFWNDSQIGIKWPDFGGQPILSDKDAAALPLAQAQVFP